MPDIYSRNSLRQSVEAASNGQMTVLYDNLGLPNFMSVLPRTTMDKLDPTMSTAPGGAGDYLGSGDTSTHVHRAFVNRYNNLSSQTYSDNIFVGQYLSSAVPNMDNIVYPVSVPFKAPLVNLTLAQAKAAAALKGPGWHVVTCWEISAFIWYAFKNFGNVRGNDYLGSSYDYNSETCNRLDGVLAGFAAEEDTMAMSYTGGGPASWRHNLDVTGMADLVGNCYQLQDGIRLKNGRIQLLVPNSISEGNIADADVFSKLGNNIYGTDAGWEYLGVHVGYNATAPTQLIDVNSINGESGYVQMEKIGTPKYIADTNESLSILNDEMIHTISWNETEVSHNTAYTASDLRFIMRELAMDANGAYNVKTKDYPNGTVILQTPQAVSPQIRYIDRGASSYTHGNNGLFNLLAVDYGNLTEANVNKSFRLAYSDPSTYTAV